MSPSPSKSAANKLSGAFTLMEMVCSSMKLPAPSLRIHVIWPDTSDAEIAIQVRREHAGGRTIQDSRHVLSCATKRDVHVSRRSVEKGASVRAVTAFHLHDRLSFRERVAHPQHSHSNDDEHFGPIEEPLDRQACGLRCVMGRPVNPWRVHMSCEAGVNDDTILSSSP